MQLQRLSHSRCMLALAISYLFALVSSFSTREGNTLHQKPLLTQSNDTSSTATPDAKPFYMIAHRVHTVQGMRDALNHGANALEMDMYAWKDGWYADHDGTIFTRGDEARTMFEAIAEERKAGQTVSFVWFDIKTPNKCGLDKRHCAVEALQDLSREILEPHGVRVQFGFYASTNNRAYHAIAGSLNANEAINLTGKTADVEAAFSASRIPPSQWIMSYGCWVLSYQFGNCHEPSLHTCTELRQATASNSFKRVFGWTTGSGHAWYVDKLLGTAGVDGLIYGFQLTSYYDHDETRTAAQHIIDWIGRHPEKRYIARQEDAPW